MVGEKKKLLHADEVAELLGMSVQMVRKAAREGTLPAYRLPGGRKFYFFEEELRPADGSDDSAGE